MGDKVTISLRPLATVDIEHVRLLESYVSRKPAASYRLAPSQRAHGRVSIDLQFIEPELREGRGEIERAAKQKLPALIRDEDLHGVLHSHTTASDGTETLEAMAEATRKPEARQVASAERARRFPHVSAASRSTAATSVK